MKKRDFKALLLMGIASGAILATENVSATEPSANLESTFLAGGGGCGGNGACAGNGNPPQGGWRNPANYEANNQGGCGAYRPRQQQQPTRYTQKNTRYSRQIAEGEEMMPVDETTATPTTTPTTTPPKAPGGCAGKSGCSGSNSPRQYRNTRN